MSELYDIFPSTYLNKSQKAEKLLNKITNIFMKSNILDSIPWFSIVLESSGFAVEIAKIKKKYLSSKLLISSQTKFDLVEEFIIKITSQIIDNGRYKDTHENVYFYIWPRLSWMLGEFVVWLTYSEERHPKLKSIISKTIPVLEEVFDYLKSNKFIAYKANIEKYRKTLTWKLKE